MKDRIVPALLALAACVLPLAAAAQQVASTAKPVHLRAGPDRAYPVVAVLPGGAQVVVQGCVADYRWCDVGFGAERGWVYAGNLRYPQGTVYVPLPAAAPAIGVTILYFGIHDYWDLHYRDRPWYPDRDRWVRPRPHGARPPRPLPPPVHPAPPPPAVRPAPIPRVPPAGRIHPPPRHVQPAP